MTSVRVDSSFVGFTSSDVPEGTNLYYTDQRVQANRLDQLSSPISDINLNGVKLTNIAAPIGNNDAVTKSYVDAAIQGLSTKDSVRVATASALPAVIYNNGSNGVGATLTAVSVGVLTIDGIPVNLNDRILIKDQLSQLQNGIYQVTTLGTSLIAFILTRTTDANTPAELIGSYVFVEDGSTNANSGFVNTNDSSTLTAIGTSNITFTQFSGAGEITAGTGLTKSGNTLSLATSGVTPGTYTKITVDTYGRATVGTSATTSDIAEGSNLYFTNSRARTALSGTSPVNYDNTTGIISLGIVPIANGGTSASDAPTARTNLDTRRNRINYILVKSLSDLPAPSGGVITLADNTDYEISGTISFGTNTLTVGNNCSIFGENKNNDVLSYTGTGTFITIQHRCRFGFIGFSCPSGTLFNINGSVGTERVRLENLTMTGIGTLGSITNVDHIEILTCNITNTVTTGFTITGTTLSILKIVNCYLNNNAGTFLALGSSTFTGMSIEANVIKLSAGQTFLSGSGPTITSVQVAGNAFLNSGGTILSGITLNDFNWFFFANAGLDNTQYVGENYMSANATVTTVATAGTFVKIAGTTTSGQLANFTNPTNNKLQYVGSVTKNFLVVCRGFFTCPTNNAQIQIKIFKNGVSQDKTLGEMFAATSGQDYNIGCQGIIQLAQNDYIEIYATNVTVTNNNPTFVNLIVSIIAS